jgi:hypothetical protein
MSTVTYRHQPGIHATRGTVPLAGTRHVYTVSKVLWPGEVEAYIASKLIPWSLHACCGLSQLGDVRVDLHEPTADRQCDVTNLPYSDNQFKTVLCDPPYNGSFRWNHDMLKELSRVASQRIIFQHWFIPATADGLYKKAHDKFALSSVAVWQPRTYFGRAQLISGFDRREGGDE